MDRRFTAAIVLVFVALLAVALWFDRSDGEPVEIGAGTATPTPQPLLELEAAGIQNVGVVGATGSYTLTRVAGGWQVDGEDASDAVDGVVEELAAPNVVGEIPSDRNPDDYGFATPALTVTLLTAAGDDHVIEVGDQVLMGSEYYVRLSGEDRIVWVSGYNIDQLKDWLEEPPLAPTATPEVTQTPEGEESVDDEAEAEEEADAEGEAATQDEGEPPEADEAAADEDEAEATDETEPAEATPSTEAEGTGEPEEGAESGEGDSAGDESGEDETPEPTEASNTEP